MTKEKFMIRAYGKSEYAMMLFPHIDDPKVAQAKLLRWIKKDKQFHQSLVGMGLSSHDKDYSPGREVTSSPPEFLAEPSGKAERGGVRVVCARLCRLLPSGRKNKGQCNICGQL